MKPLYCIVLLSFLFLTACKPQAEKKQKSVADSVAVSELQKPVAEVPLTAGNVTLAEEDFGELIELKGAQRLLDEEGPIFKLSEPEMQIKGGYLLLQNRPTMQYVHSKDGDKTKTKDEGLAYFFHWYRLPDFRYITSFGIAGNGPNEFTFPHLVPSGLPSGNAYVYETTTRQMYQADTTGSMKPCPFTFKSIKGSTFSDREICAAARDTFYFVDNVPRGKAIMRSVYQGDTLQTEQIYDLAFSKKHRSWSPYIGDFIVSPSGNRMVYAYKYFRKILVMDKNAQTVRDISFEEKGVDAKSDVLTLGPDNTTYYWGISATDEYFFLTYSGRTPIQVGRETDKGDGFIFVEQYDWGGNPIARYKLDHWGRVMSDGKQLYQLCYKYDDPLFLYSISQKK